jgi:hypothetical protein
MLPPNLLFLLIAALLVLGYLAWLRSKQEEVKRRRRRLAMFAEVPEPASPALQAMLIQMVEGDRQEAERLVDRARFGHPRRSESFYWLRAIQQLQQRRGEAVISDDFEIDRAENSDAEAGPNPEH